jgi:hypothetical protein
MKSRKKKPYKGHFFYFLELNKVMCHTCGGIREIDSTHNTARQSKLNVGEGDKVD